MRSETTPGTILTNLTQDHHAINRYLLQRTTGFLGFCAVIVVAQVLPAVMMMVGMVKGVVAEGTEVKAHN